MQSRIRLFIGGLSRSAMVLALATFAVFAVSNSTWKPHIDYPIVSGVACCSPPPTQHGLVYYASQFGHWASGTALVWAVLVAFAVGFLNAALGRSMHRRTPQDTDPRTEPLVLFNGVRL